MILKPILVLFFYLLASYGPTSVKLEEELKQIDKEFSGNLGVYIKALDNGKAIELNTDREWYLASTIKIPLAIAILHKVEEGELSLEHEITLQTTDFVDGAGDLILQKPGTPFTVLELLKRMIRDSDSTATDMLIRLLGEEEFNNYVSENLVSDGLGPITTILQVRYDAYSEIHENASKLTNLDIIKLKEVVPLQKRMDELLKMMGVSKDEAKVHDMFEAFEKYYERGLNSGKLQTMGTLLEKLEKREYLNEGNSTLLLNIMKEIVTGDKRLKAGLPKGTAFAHKTGTQIGRACNIGIIYPANGSSPIIVAVCVEKYKDLREAEPVFQKVGRAIKKHYLD